MMTRKTPKKWSQVTLKDLIEIEAIKNDKSIDKELYPELTRYLLILSLFTGIPYSVYEQMPINKLKQETKKLNFLNELPKAGQVKYFFCRNYVWKVNYDVKKMTAGQFISHYELTKDHNKIFENANKLLALYCQPQWFGIKKKMTDEEKAERLLHAPVDAVYPLVLFFCRLYPSLLEAIKDYLTQAKEMLDQKLEKEINQQAV